MDVLWVAEPRTQVDGHGDKDQEAEVDVEVGEEEDGGQHNVEDGGQNIEKGI